MSPIAHADSVDDSEGGEIWYTHNNNNIIIHLVSQKNNSSMNLDKNKIVLLL